MNNIKEIVKALASDGDKTALVCKVTAVDRDKRTIDCEPINETAPLLSVNLQANQGSSFGVVEYPKVGSYVICGFMAGGAAACVLLTDEVEEIDVEVGSSTINVKDGKIAMNGGNNEGLINIKDLVSRLNAIEEDINNAKSYLSAAVPGTQDGGANIKSAMSKWCDSSLTKTSQSDIEDTSITH